MRSKAELWMGQGQVFVFSHRGPEKGAENSLRGFRSAIDHGADGLESDLRLSKDGHLMLTHDATVDRLFDATGRVEDFTRDELQGMAFRDGRPDDRMATLDEAFEEFRHVPLNIDPKDERCIEPLARALQRHNRDFDIVTSFRDADIAEFRRRRPQNLTGAATHEASRFFAGYLASRVTGDRLVGKPPFQLLQLPHLLKGVPILYGGFVDYCHRHSLVVHAWTARNEGDVERLASIGVDGVMSDVPVRDVVGRLGKTWDPSRTQAIVGGSRGLE